MGGRHKEVGIEARKEEQMKKTKRAVDDRKGWLGGSSWGGALGISTYSTPLEIAKEYLGEKREVSPELQERFDMGHELEDFIARQTERIYKVKPMKTSFLYLSDRDERLGCHPDRLVQKPVDGKRVALEIKSSSVYDNGRWGNPDTDEVPYDYLVQCYSYFECVGVDEVWLMRFANNQLTRYIVGRPDQVILDKIAYGLISFMDNADKGILPEPLDYAEAVRDYANPKDGDITAPQCVLDSIREWNEIKAKKKTLEKREDEIKKKLVEFLKESKKSRIVDADGKRLASYSTTEATRLDSKRLKEEEPEVYEKYSYTSTSTSLR